MGLVRMIFVCVEHMFRLNSDLFKGSTTQQMKGGCESYYAAFRDKQVG